MVLLMTLLAMVTSTLDVAAAAPAPPATRTAAGPQPGNVSVAVANAREGALVHRPVDLRDGDDRRALARRLFTGRRRLPDVVLLQEVHGSAGKVVAQLNRHPRAQRAGAAYRLLTRTRLAHRTGRCDGPRGRHLAVRTSVIAVNTATVRPTGRTGVTRTWGRWRRNGGGAPVDGCAEHPWADLTVAQPGRAPRRVLVTSLHVSPAGGARAKSRALQVVAARMDERRLATGAGLVVIGGDTNLTRCRPPSRGERLHCAPRAGHRALEGRGYVDAVRALHPTGLTGVEGVQHRVDHLYVKGRVGWAWFDRCYRAYRVDRHPCRPEQVTFPTDRRFQACQRAATRQGRPGEGCPRRWYRRYYSDHPAIRAVLR